MSNAKRRLWYHGADSERCDIGEDELLGLSAPLIILGEPGMGKSELLTTLARSADLSCCTARQLINRPDPTSLLGGGSLIVIDALDEVAARREGDAVDLALQKLGNLGYPRFILSCRVADWQAATSIAAIKEQYPEEPLQLHLEPLNRDEQQAILAGKVGDERAEEILKHFEKYGLDFLGNPQTLELIARLPQNSCLPTNSGELFEQAIETLRVEHRVGNGTNELARNAALDAAGAAFASLILSGSASITRVGSANLSDGEIHLSDVEELGGGNVARVINTRLFAGRNDSFTYWHRRIGEFLGASWLAKRADSRKKRRRLLQLFHAQGLVPANLRGLHAWLARDLHFAKAVIAVDPMGIIEYGDADALAQQQATMLLGAISRIARENPHFWRWSNVHARSLVSPHLHDQVALILKDTAAPSGLRAILAKQLADAGRAEPFREILRQMLLDPGDVFAIRSLAGDALSALNAEDWPSVVDMLRCQGSEDATRLAFELMEQLGLERFSDEQVIEVILAHDGLALSAWPREIDGGLAVRFWRLADRVPPERLDGLLDTLTRYARELLPQHAGIDEHDLVDLAYALILRRLERNPVEPLILCEWLQPYEEQHSYERDSAKKVAEWIQQHVSIRQAIQRHLILNRADQSIWHAVMRLSRRSLGLAPNEADIIALLNALDPADTSDMRWREVLELLQHNGETGRAAREAAEPFAHHNPQFRSWLDDLATPCVPEWQIKQDQERLERAAKRAAQFAEQRRDYLTNLDKVRTGDFRYIHPLAKAYLKRFSDIREELAPHERIADWLGEDVAEAGHEGFEAFLSIRPAHPSATRIAVSFAKGRRWSACNIIIAGLAERVRTRPSPFADLTDERLIAGMFELWHWRIDTQAGLPDLLERIEGEIRQRGSLETALRLYITPQLKRRSAHIDHLHPLMNSEPDADLASKLAIEWLKYCDDLPSSPEAEMIKRVLRSPLRNELLSIGNIRRELLLKRDRRRNWDAVQFIVDFEGASTRLTTAIEPELLWHIRSFCGGRYSDEPASLALNPRQIAWLTAAFRKSWPATSRPSGVTSGDDNPWDASSYIYGLISRLGEDTSSDAISALEMLRDQLADGYADHIRAVIAEQRQKRAEQSYTPPTLRQLGAVLNAGPAADEADLQALVLDALETVQAWLKGNDVDWYRGFFREDGNHKNEELCRDEIIKMLRAADNSIEYIPESHSADDKRVDIVVRANEKLILPIEIKGQWHPRLWSAADKQLDHLYVNDWRATRGIYLVLWFGDGTSLPKRPEGMTQPSTPDELQKALKDTSRSAADGRTQILVLDLTRPQQS